MTYEETTVSVTVDEITYEAHLTEDGSVGLSVDGEWASRGRWGGKAIEDAAGALCGVGEEAEARAYHVMNALDSALLAALTEQEGQAEEE